MYTSYHGGFPPGGPPSSTEPTDLRQNRRELPDAFVTWYTNMTVRAK